MRIMLVTDTFPPSVNGAAVATARLAASLADGGDDVAVVAPSPAGYAYTEAQGRVVVFRLRSIPTTYPGQPCALPMRRAAAGLLRAFEPDLLHVQSHFVVGTVLARAARARGLAVVGTNHVVPENLLAHVPKLFLRAATTRRLLTQWLWQHLVAFYQALDAVTAPSRAAAALLRAYGLRLPVHVISNGVDIARFHPAPVRTLVEPGRAVALYVGRLDPEKGLETVMRAMPRVLARYPVELVVCGRGPHERVLRRLCGTLGITAHVRFIGFVADCLLPDLYRGATVFVMPSPHELQSLATLEAMASGLPVVAADALALPELVHDEENGVRFPPEDVRGLAEALADVLSDPTRRTQMGRASRAMAECHGLDSTLAALRNLYATVRERP
jgi:1,2-diacylglycerol 3-alpha-glucosyltransferase